MRTRKKLGIIGLVLLVFILSSVNVGLASPNISGKFESALGMRLDDPYHLDGKNELYLNIDQFVGEAAFHVGVQLKDIWPNKEFKLNVDEAYIDYYAANFDLRVGKQRFSWGTALKINPTSVLNPVNINDPMGDKIPVFAGAIDYFVTNDIKITGVFIPFHEPAMENLGGLLPDVGIDPNKLESLIVKKPEPSLRNSAYALKLTMMDLSGYDFSVSYFRGKEDTPTLEIKNGVPRASYPDIKIIGADFATAIDDFGLWAEGAYTIVEGGDDDYYQWIAGGDYGFSNGIVLVGQFLVDSKLDAGFVILGLEKELLGMHNGRLGLLYNLDTQGYMLSPEADFSLRDGIDLTLGANYFANENKVLGLVPKEESSVYVQLSTSF